MHCKQGSREPRSCDAARHIIIQPVKIGSHWIPLLNFHSALLQNSILLTCKGNLLMTRKVSFLCENEEFLECLFTAVVSLLGKNRWQAEVACVSVFQGRRAGNIRTQSLDNSTKPQHPPFHHLQSHYQ